MNATSDTDTLRAYLLGRLAPEAREGIEARLFTDDRVFWERLCVEEEQLIDDYAAGRLDGEAEADFERHFLCTDERRSKLEFVRALQSHLSRRQHQRAVVWDWLRFPTHVPRWALAAAATLILALPIAVWQFEATRPQFSDVAVWLPPGNLRAEGTLRRVRVSADCRLIRLQLDPGSDVYPVYRATVHEVTGEERLSQGQLKVSSVERRPAVTLTLPCEVLPQGDYYVRLHGLAPGREPVALGRYDVRVLRE